MVSFEWLPLVDQDMKTCGPGPSDPRLDWSFMYCEMCPWKREKEHILFKLRFCTF